MVSPIPEWLRQASDRQRLEYILREPVDEAHRLRMVECSPPASACCVPMGSEPFSWLSYVRLTPLLRAQIHRRSTRHESRQEMSRSAQYNKSQSQHQPSRRAQEIYPPPQELLYCPLLLPFTLGSRPHSPPRRNCLLLVHPFASKKEPAFSASPGPGGPQQSSQTDVIAWAD